MKNRSMLIKLLWLGFVAYAAAGNAVVPHCERLRVPRASVEHELVHLATFENVYEQARRLVSDWHMPAYKSESVSRQLLGAFEDMARHATSEALVNLTLDHTLAYQVDDDATQTARWITIQAERPLNETVLAFCEQYEIDDCDELYAQLFALVVRDWGCHDDDHTATDTAPNVSDTTRSNLAPIAGKEYPEFREEVGDILSLPILTVRVDDEDQNVTVYPDQDLELQAVLLCRQWRTPLDECANVMAAMHALTLDHPAFSRIKEMATPRSSSEFGLEISQPVQTRLNPVSQRIYFDGVWLDGASHLVEERHHVCLFYGYDAKPQICGRFPPEEMWFFKRDSLREGYHLVYFTEPVPVDEKDQNSTPGVAIAARHFWVVRPTVKLLDIQLRPVNSTVLVVLTIETVAFDLLDPEFRVCALVDDTLDCFQPHRLHMEHATETPNAHDRKTVFTAALFQVGSGKHSALLLLLNSFNQAFAHSEIATFEVTIDPHMALAPRDPTYFFEPPSVSHMQRPTSCPPPIESSGLDWICRLWRHEWGRFSQNGEDGILQSIFYYIGTTNRYYIEFGTEDARECNTRLLRESYDWQGLLLDGGHANASIHLYQEWIAPENINTLFTKYDVPREFDVLSIDVDFNDYWILDALDRTKFSPRVIIIEVNAHIPPSEPRVVQYAGPSARWDGKTAYFGVGVGAVHLWGTRHGYSLVYCESHGVNCFLVREDVLASVISGDNDFLVVSDHLSAQDLHAPPNFFGRNASYPWPTPDSGIVEDWVWLEMKDI